VTAESFVNGARPTRKNGANQVLQKPVEQWQPAAAMRKRQLQKMGLILAQTPKTFLDANVLFNLM